MKKILPLVLILSALIVPGALSAKNFEGTIRMTMADGRNEKRPLEYSVREGLIRTDMEVGEGTSATAIMNFAKDEMIMLMPGQPMYMVMSLKRAAKQATGHTGDQPTLEKTGVTEKILGYDCTKYIVKSKGVTTEIWATEELGSFAGFGAGMDGQMGKGSASQSWETALIGKNFFPMRVVTLSGKKEKYRLEVTAVEPKSLPASFFAPPEGYRKFDMGGMMQGMGGGNPFGQ